MLQDLETLAPSAIVCVAFLIGVIALLRREMAPKRRHRAGSEVGQEPEVEDSAHEEHERSEL